MPNSCEVAIVGAGPNGLSLAAHLRASGISFRIFGKPMTTWREHMPKGMFLKSEGFASNLSAPDRQSTLESWCRINGVPYAPQKSPVALDTFNAYATWFAKTYVPQLEEKNVTHIVAEQGGYVLTLENGDTVHAARVVLAVGITWYKSMPKELASLSPRHASHSFDHHDCRQFKDRDVTVLGAGASAVDTALALHDAGARVNVLTRRKAMPFHSAPDNDQTTLLSQLQAPGTGIGPGWRSFFCVNTPLLFHRLPQKVRLEATRKHLGPAPGWFTRDRFEAAIPANVDYELKTSHVVDGRVALTLRHSNGRQHVMMTDHVVAATGYRADLSRLPFLDGSLTNQIAQVEGTPILSDNFEASLPNLYFLGLSAANSFGPLLRFMCGAEFAAPRLCNHLRRRIGASRQSKAA